MKILVTGGTGFTGSHLVRRLINNGHDVHVLDIEKGNNFDELTTMGATIVLGTITDKTLVDNCVKGCDLVYHLAAAFRQINVSKKFYWDVNVEGTRNLLEAALNSHVQRFINCSTIGIYGDVKNPPADELSVPAPNDYYQYTKLEGEKLAKEYSAKGLYTVNILPAGIYGPGDLGRFLMLYRFVKRGVFYMFSDGSAFYHTLYIDNLIDAFELATEVEGINGEAFIIADEKHYTLNELVAGVADSMGTKVKIQYLPFFPLWISALICEMLCKPFGISPPLFRRRVDWFRSVRAFSIEKAVEVLGYNPKVGLAEGLHKTATWYKKHGFI